MNDQWGVGAVVILGVIVAFLIYFTPAIIAQQRKHPQREAITAVNFLLGWTLIGWVASLAWALSAPANPQETRACPYCAETILSQAIRCKHCGTDVRAAASPPVAPSVR